MKRTRCALVVGIAMRRLALVGLAVLALTGCGGNGSGAGSSGHAFCDTHACIPNFSNGSGYIVQCNDGMWSHSGGEAGACSYHGGER
jgi:hypothetical protein